MSTKKEDTGNIDSASPLEILVLTCNMNSFRIAITSTAPAPNQGTLEGLLVLLNQNQNNAINPGGNLTELIKLLVNQCSNTGDGRAVHVQAQPHPSLSLLHQPMMAMTPAFHSSAPLPCDASPPPAASRQQAPMADPQQEFLRSSSNQELEAMIRHLQNNLVPSTLLPSSAQGEASRVAPQTQHGTMWTTGESDYGSSLDAKIQPKVRKSAATLPPSILKSSNAKHLKTAPSHSLAPPPQPVAGSTQGKEILLYRDIDEFYLTEYQCLLRQQIELFEATDEDLQASAQGRNSPIQIGQIGIRCKYCAAMPIKCRSRGAVYFPRSINGIYQVAQNLTKIHLCNSCTRVPENIRKKLTELSTVNKRASGGKRYWIERVREIGIYEDGKAIRFKMAST